MLSCQLHHGLRRTKIKSIRIRNSRSIDDLHLDLQDLTVICGPNSCGKSNILEAVKFAFQADITQEEVYRNLPSSKRDLQGAPLLSIWIDMTLAECSEAITKIAGVPKGTNVKYSFRAVRSGSVTRKLGDSALDKNSERDFLGTLSIVYVPPIRDLSADGLEPFRSVFGDVLRKARGKKSLRSVGVDARKVLTDRAKSFLPEHAKLVRTMLGAQNLGIDTDNVDLDRLYEDVSLNLHIGGNTLPLEELGTGHQSAIIIHLYRQLGQLSSGETIYLFEEPGNHLHPTTLRAIGTDLRELSTKAQVLLTTHSPILMNHTGLTSIISLYADEDRITHMHKRDLSGYTTEKEIRTILGKYGVRATEPLLCRRILVVEGVTDSAILSHLVALRYGSSPDRLDLLIVPAGGKNGVVELCTLLHALDVDWMAVFDWDSALGNEIPLTKSGLPTLTVADAIGALPKLQAVLDNSKKRGRNATKCLVSCHTCTVS